MERELDTQNRVVPLDYQSRCNSYNASSSVTKSIAKSWFTLNNDQALSIHVQNLTCTPHCLNKPIKKIKNMGANMVIGSNHPIV